MKRNERGLAGSAGAVLALLLVAASTATVSCGGDWVGPNSPVVGGPCGASSQCVVESTCLLGGDFPGGMCTRYCSQLGDCPAGAVCMEAKGGICLPTCRLHSDCRPGYKCDDKDMIDKRDKALVCVKD